MPEFKKRQFLDFEKPIKDLYDQLEQIKSMGPISQLIGMVPGLSSDKLKDANIDDKLMARTEAIIKSMTPRERENPSTVNNSRKKRISTGSGTKVQDINTLLKQFEQMQKMMKQLDPKKMSKHGGFPFM